MIPRPLTELTPQHLVEDQHELLAIPTTGNLQALAKRTALKSAPGWLVHDSTAERWYFSGYVRRGDQVLLTGPYAEGQLLVAALEAEPEQAIATLARVAAALRVLSSEHGYAEPIQLNSVYLLADGGVLVFPAQIMKQLTENQSREANLAAYEQINHPDLRGSERLAFALGVLAYRAATGNFPFAAGSEEDLRNRMRRLRLVSADQAQPGLNRKLTTLIGDTLRPARGTERAALDRWATTLAAVLDEGVLTPVAAAESEERRQAAELLRARNESAFSRAVFLQRNARILIGSTIGGLLIIGIAASILSNALKPRVTQGFSPRQVVEAFYAGMGQLDHTTMEDAVIDSAGKGRINEVINLFVISRVAQGYEGRSTVVDAGEWVAADQPELPPEVSVYGAANLQISAEQGPPEPVFRVTYDFYSPGGDSADTFHHGTPMRERVFLRRDKDDWVIFNFQEIPASPGT